VFLHRVRPRLVVGRLLLGYQAAPAPAVPFLFRHTAVLCRL
jgi:hypothetical protein